MSDHWFRPKGFGYGATPINWKGWLSTLVFVIVLAVPTVLLVVLPAVGNSGPAAWQVIMWLVLVALLSLIFMRFARTRTEGEWQWRWGGR